MFARLVLLKGEQDDAPYRWDMPNSTLVSADREEMTCIVSFNMRDGPPDCPRYGDELYPLLGDKYVLVGLTERQHVAWWTHLAKRYPRREPPYMPAFP